MMKFFVFALFISIIQINAECPMDSSKWCTTVDYARACGVFDQCLRNVWQPINPYLDPKLVQKEPILNADLVNFTLYYETLCPDCKNFMTTQLWTAYQSISSIMNLTVVPYGNARESFNSSTNLWDFTCQHGSDECFGNILHTCFIYYNPKTADHMPFIHCMEANNQDTVRTAAVKCAQQLNITLSKVFDCTTSQFGNLLEHQMALQTDALQPQHKYVPWVTLNGVHTEEIEQAAEKDLVKLICETYQGSDKPSACKKKL